MSSLTKVMKKTFLAAVCLTVLPVAGVDPALFGASIAHAESSIVVRGNKRIEAETIRSYVAGKGRSAADVDAGLKALYATNLFSDVKIASEGGTLVITVVEAPQINKVVFEGNKRLTDEQLGSVIQIKSRGFMSKASVQSDVQRLLEAYRRNGRYRAQVEAKVISLADNRVNLVYEIDEGDKTAVTRIGFVGNHAYSAGRLRDVVKTRETGLLGWLRSTDTYDPERLQSDQDLIRKFYMKNGYADFRIVSATADLDRERNVFFVSFTIDEGDQYSFGDIDVQTSLAGLDQAKLARVVGTKSGNTYSSDDVEKTMEALTYEATQAGYAFATVRPRAVRDYATHKISITYYVEEGARVYVERINVRGNDRTRDYVVRREMDMSEGDAYNKALVSKAERRLNRLGYFKSVKLNTEQGSSPDRVVVNIDVEEQSTGEIGFGAGYSTTDGVLGDVSFSEKNFLGRGQFIKASVQLGQKQRGWGFSFTEPYFLGYRISAGFDVYQKQYLENDYRNYEQRDTGGTLRFGLPITENLTFGVNYTINDQRIKLNATQANDNYSDGEASLAYKRYVCPSYQPGNSAACGNWSRTRLTSAPGYSLVYNSLDSLQFPRDGAYAKFTQEFAGAGGDARFVRTTFDARYYREIWADWGIIGMARVKGGNITGIGESVELFDNFFLGGETIRGFAPQGIGPRDQSVSGTGYKLNESLGAKNYVAGTLEATMPFPGTPEEFGLYVSTFADAGLAWGVDSKSLPKKGTYGSGSSAVTFNYVDDMALRSSVGAGLVWRSPFGPLRADFAIPLSKSKYDQTQYFRFSGGTTF
ncbi:outer membrane protein assembly factor BamA [Siculibacillus lacustris]|uniref:Outer membrane protein assembly factor BamA n=1 Tax=Siculibacillus lacustris TaxID=1549641 RepID=A0A4Q9VSK8_9HYPH|nr:outer membrane protein assembly factor BamA [Siculibacillus lacustris]TBW38486.1 outer membrane protein assembly factor BamA [Siculibacillus lacustris]